MASGSSLLSNLTRGARAAFPMFQSLAGSDLTASQVISQVRNAGFSFRTQAGYDILAALRNTQSATQYFRQIPSNQVPDPSKFTKAPNNQLRNYSYRLTVRGVNPDTGEQVARNLTISTNDPLSMDQLNNAIPDVIGKTPGSDEIEDFTFSVDAIYANPNLF